MVSKHLTMVRQLCQFNIRSTTSRFHARSIATTPLLRKWNEKGEYEEVPAPPRPSDQPFKRTAKILTHDIMSLVDPNLPPLMEFQTHVDICIIGGGVMGSAIAYFLKQRVPRDALKITVIEKDPTYTRSSTVLSVGGLRQQFSLKENIEMSMFSADFLRRAPELLAVEDAPPPEMGFHPHGYLFLASESGADQLIENYALQKELGAKSELLSKDKLKEKFPWINSNGIELACHGLENEGWFDPWSLLMGFKRKAIDLGVEYVKAEVVGFTFETRDDIIVAGTGDQFQEHEVVQEVLVKTPSGEVKAITAAQFVLAAGHESGKIAEMCRIGRGDTINSVPCPVEPRKRYVYCFHAPQGPGLDCPLVIDPSGAYFRREGYGGLYIGGQSPPYEDEPNVENLDVDYNYFDQTVWPNLANRVPAFENLKVKSAWAGYYDYNTFDQNAIIGPHPYYSRLIFATGFSGHGIQQAPAVGRAIMEWILDGYYRTIDVSRFGFDRFIVGREVREKNIV